MPLSTGVACVLCKTSASTEHMKSDDRACGDHLDPSFSSQMHGQGQVSGEGLMSQSANWVKMWHHFPIGAELLGEVKSYRLHLHTPAHFLKLQPQCASFGGLIHQPVSCVLIRHHLHFIDREIGISAFGRQRWEGWHKCEAS